MKRVGNAKWTHFTSQPDQVFSATPPDSTLVDPAGLRLYGLLNSTIAAATVGGDFSPVIRTFAFVDSKGERFRRKTSSNLVFVAFVVIKQALHRVEGESRFYVAIIKPNSRVVAQSDIHDVQRIFVRSHHGNSNYT